MATHVALLRGINVGGRNKVAMADLREIMASLGHTDVATYIQSGNVVFSTDEKDTATVAAAIEKAVEDRVGVRAAVLVLTRAELARIARDNPYPDEPNPKLVHVVFLPAEPAPEMIASVAAAQDTVAQKGSRDTAQYAGRALFLHTPDGFGRSELAALLSPGGPADVGQGRGHGPERGHRPQAARHVRFLRVGAPLPPISPDAGRIRLGQPRGRWIIAATVLGSSMAMLDATAVNVALPTIGKELNTSLAGLQWVVTAYTLTLAGLILLGGALGDRFGRRRVFLIGVTWFALSSALCGLAPNIGVLIAARALQGIGGALLTPGSLAIIQSTFAADDRPRAIGAWSGLGGVAGAIGPFLGGWIVGSIGWRWIFLINLPLAVAVLAVTSRHVPESRDPTAQGRFDIAGAVLAALALAGITDGLIEAPSGRPARVRGAGPGGRRRRGRVRPAGTAAWPAPRAGPADAAPGNLLVPPVHRHQPDHVRRVRGDGRGVLPARARPPGGRGLHAPAGRDLVAALHGGPAAAVVAGGGAGPSGSGRAG